ncbi:MAG: hypothetical protein ACREGE_03980 [Candidatus Microsaccharimonas sp.]
MKRSRVGTPTKLGLLATAVVGLLAMGGVTTAAYAADGEWAPQSTRELYPVYENEAQCYDGMEVLVSAADNVVAGEVITDTLLDGKPLTGDAETRVGPGVHNYTYIVTNLNSEADPKESVTKSGSFTVVECPPPAPSVTLGPITATANDDGIARSIPVSGSVTLANLPDNAEVTIVTTASNGVFSVTPVPAAGSFSTTLLGDFPDGTVGVTSQVYVNGTAAGASSSTSVVFTAPVEPQPEAPIVDAHLNGILTDDNKSAVHAVVTVDRNDAEGPLTVVIAHGDSENPDATLEFIEDTETLRVTFPMDTCGDIEFSVRFADSQNEGQTSMVNVPCPETDNGTPGNDGDNGGTPGGGDDNSGGDKGDTDDSKSTVTTPKQPTGNTVPGGKTDGFGLSSSDSAGVSPLVFGGASLAVALMIAIGVVAYQRRQSLAGE